MLLYLRKFYIPAILCATVVMILSVLPAAVFPKVDINYADLMVHTIMYFTLCWLVLWSTALSGLQLRHILITVLLCSLYGFIIECIQGLWCIGRFFDIYDAFANTVGASLTILPARFVWPQKK